MITKELFLLAICTLPAAAQVRFEVASVRPSRPGAVVQESRMNFRGDRFDATAVTVGDILDTLAGALFRVEGGPPWMKTDRYDIAAKAATVITGEDRSALLMGLLEDRFNFASHRETRDVATLVLLAPKTPPGLRPAAADAVSSIRMVNTHTVFTAAPMSLLVNYLSQMWHAPVVDRTGLTGRYDFSLDPARVEISPGEVWADRVRTAITEFGFKVETQKIPTEITVVDRCERPSGN
jgi:uncharacterized protein (TIGR03435 family)